MKEKNVFLSDGTMLLTMKDRKSCQQGLLNLGFVDLQI